MYACLIIGLYSTFLSIMRKDLIIGRAVPWAFRWAFHISVAAQNTF